MIDEIDEMIDEMTTALETAHTAALASGPVVIARDGKVLRIFPDGREELVKYIEKPTTVEPGTILHLT